MAYDLRHNCGFAVTHSLDDVFHFLSRLQHRGREAAGIAAVGHRKIDVLKWAGPVSAFDKEDLRHFFPESEYHSFMGHVRYATKGRKEQILEDAHPHVIGGTTEHHDGYVIVRGCQAAMVHNGQVPPEYLESVSKDKLKTGCDTEALLHLIEDLGHKELLRRVPGAYTLAYATIGSDRIIGLRDRSGIKPGVLGFRQGKYCLASEDIAFGSEGRVEEDMDPGAVYYLYPEGNFNMRNVVDPDPSKCFFEWLYIAGKEAELDGLSVRKVRETLGDKLAEEFPFTDLDYITFVPRCPEAAAKKYARALDVEFLNVFAKKNSARSFMGSTPEDRAKSIRRNLTLIDLARDKIAGKKIGVIDDSTIRGTNGKRARDLLFEAGVEEIRLINYTPKIGPIGKDGTKHGCIYGVDMSPNDNFIVRTPDGKNRTDSQINKAMGMKTYFLSLEGLLQTFDTLGIPPNHLCTFCVGGKHPF